MGQADQHDTWASGGQYELYIGRWSRLVARSLLQWLVASPGPGRRAAK